MYYFPAPPKITKPSDIVAMAGEQYKLSIEITGTPDPVVKFFNNGKEIVEDYRVKFHKAGNYYLVKYDKLLLTDAGAYSVRCYILRNFPNNQII